MINSLISPVFLFPLLFSFLVALATTPITIKLATHFGWVEDPKKKKHPKIIHDYPVPRIGGVPIVIALLFSSLLFLPFDKHLLGILAGALLVVIVGVIDDRYDLNPYLRIFTGLLSAGLVVGVGLGIAFITNPLGGIIHLDQPRIYFDLLGKTRSIWILADSFALIWIVWCMNMVNWSSGLDGQLSGMVPVAAFTIALLSFRFTEDVTQWNIAILAAITAGAYLGFLPFHFYPQKIMPGYSGASLAGFLLAVLAILSGAKVGTLLLVLGIPMIDGAYTITRRLLSGKSPVWGDRGHLHHRLLDLGWNKRQVAYFYWFITALLGLIALNLNSQQKFYTIIMLALIIGGFLIWITYLGKIWSSPPGRNNG